MDALSRLLGAEAARALEWHLIGPLQSNKTRSSPSDLPGYTPSSVKKSRAVSRSSLLGLARSKSGPGECLGRAEQERPWRPPRSRRWRARCGDAAAPAARSDGHSRADRR